MFRIKICGITCVEDARMVAAAGADAIGLNFFPMSPRYVSPERAQSIVDALPSGVLRVGLFVNAPSWEVNVTFDRLRLDLIQLHGDEPPEFVPELEGRPFIRAFRFTASDLERVAGYLEACRRLECLPRLCLMDSFKKDQYGGTGQVADWSGLGQYPLEDWHPPMVLAGGLTPENVGQAIQAVRPQAVDTASGVESSPGHKDPERVRRFVQAAQAAFRAL
jgi:phosphoribosylanthranilate isomerase